MLYLKIAAVVLLPIMSFLGGWFYKKFKNVPQDNMVEEVVEKIIKETMGKDVDLSPDTPEDLNGD